MCQLLSTIVILLVTVGVFVSGGPVQAPSVQPRLIIGFGQFISHYTGRSPFAYNNYGCWCGTGNKGQTVMDSIDACCKTHDGCYKGFGSLASYYIINSSWQCSNDPSSAQYKACMCDKTAAQCFARNTYNANMKGKCK